MRRHLREAVLDDAFKGARDRRIDLPHRRIAIEADLLHHRTLGVFDERLLPREHLIEDDADAEEIATIVDLIADDLLGTHIARRANPRPGLGKIAQPIAAR